MIKLYWIGGASVSGEYTKMHHILAVNFAHKIFNRCCHCSVEHKQIAHHFWWYFVDGIQVRNAHANAWLSHTLCHCWMYVSTVDDEFLLIFFYDSVLRFSLIPRDYLSISQSRWCYLVWYDSVPFQRYRYKCT